MFNRQHAQQKRIEKRHRKPSLSDMIAKVIVILILGTAYIGMGMEALDEASDYRFSERNLATLTTTCDGYYYKKKYGELHDYLKLYDLYNSNFEKYWEIVDGTKDYQQYQQYLRAEKLGLEDATEQKAYYQNRIEENAKNCKYPENQKQLDSYVSEVQ